MAQPRARSGREHDQPQCHGRQQQPDENELGNRDLSKCKFAARCGRRPQEGGREHGYGGQPIAWWHHDLLIAGLRHQLTMLNPRLVVERQARRIRSLQLQECRFLDNWHDVATDAAQVLACEGTVEKFESVLTPENFT